ncbi:MAG: energy transducer TonB, partial [Bacteroidales bacterium]|nr:energy transducer TonB [Bacteroidales bacterium]
AVLRSGTDIKDYQYLLIRKAVGKSGYSVSNSFNHSILKNRITMMSKTKTPYSRRLRALWLLPLVCLGLGLQARTVYVPTGEENHRKGLIVLKIDESGTVTLDGREISREDIAKELEEHIRSLDVPKWLIAVKIEADENAPEDAQSYVKNSLWDAFHASSEHIYILRSANGKETEISREEFRQINQGRIRSVDVLEGDDAIEKYGEKAASGVVLVNMKRPQELDEIVVTSYGDKDEDEVVRFVPAEPSTMPMFQGEDRMAFSRWLNARIRRPKGCTHQGEMKVSFVVGTDGKVRDVKVTQSICEALDAMVTSQIEQSPEWEPATLNGDPVEQGLSIPIVFQMR